MKKPTTEKEAEMARIECDVLFCALKRIEELENDKKFLIETGEKLVRWVESPRHTQEEVRDHNGRLKDTKIWAAFYVAVRGIQRKDKTLTRADLPQNVEGHSRGVATNKNKRQPMTDENKKDDQASAGEASLSAPAGSGEPLTLFDEFDESANIQPDGVRWWKSYINLRGEERRHESRADAEAYIRSQGFIHDSPALTDDGEEWE
jgi:hypothetical protein